MRPAEVRRRGLPGLLLAAAAIGVAAAAGVWLFEQAVAGSEWVAFGWRGASWAEVPAVMVLVVPVVGGLVVGLLLHFAGVPEEPGHGVTEVIEAATLDVEEFPHRQVPVKVSAAALSLGSGASLGPEDPAIEIGGGIAETAGRALGVPRDTLRALVAAGAAGGICAAFHAPFGAVLFAVEVLAVRVLSRTAVLVAAASVAAYLVTSALSPEPPFHVPRPASPAWQALLFCIGIGLIAGGLAAAHIRFTYWVRHRFHEWRRPPSWLKPAIGGLVLGAVGVGLPQLLGTGYDTIESLTAGEIVAIPLLLLLLAGKVVLVAVSFGSGFPGGFFAPSLMIGATLGALAGAMLEAWIPATVGGGAAAFAVVGMTATLGAMVHAPLTAVFVVGSIAGGYEMFPFLLPAALAGYWAATRLERRSLYTYTLAALGSARHPMSEAPDFGVQRDGVGSRARRRRWF